MKPLFLILLLSGCVPSGPQWNYQSICSSDGVSYWAFGNRFAIRLDKDGKVIPCQP